LQDIGDALIRLRQELDLTMLLVEQNVGVARRLCDRAIVIEHGRARAAGSMEQLLADQSLANIYLGGET
jgi:ABC-type branched-subunit amino acid transport system ATPase component